MKNVVALSLLLIALAAVVFLSPEPLYVHSAASAKDEGEGGAWSLLNNVGGATRDVYQSAAEYAEKTGEGLRQTGANVADRVSSMMGSNPDCEDIGTEQRSLLERATEAVNWKAKQQQEAAEEQKSILDRAAEAVSWRSKQQEEEEKQAGILSRAAESVGLSGGDKSKEAHEAEELTSWQRAKEKLNEASHAASEAASHVKEALFHKSSKGTQKVQETTGNVAGQAAETAKRSGEKVQEGAQSTYSTLQDTAAKAKDTLGSTVERAKETLTAAKDTAGEKLQGGAQATYSTLQDTAGKARETLGSTAEKAKETIGRTFSSTHETASQGARTAYDTGARSVGSAYETAGGAYNTASDYGASAYNTAREKAAAAFDLASDKAGSMYETMYIAVQILSENVKSIPSKTAEYAGLASEKLGSTTQSARETANEVGSAAYERASGAGSSVYDTVTKTPESVQGTLEYMKSKMPDISTESFKQRAREAGEYLPNLGEGLSQGGSKFEELYENLKQKLSLGRNEEERRGIVDEFKNSLSGYSQEDRKGILENLKAKLGYRSSREEPKTRHQDAEGKRRTIEEFAEKLASAPTKEERSGVLEGVKDMLGGYSKDERKGIIDGLKEKLASYTPRRQQKGVLEEWKNKVSAYFKYGNSSPSLDEIIKVLARAGPEERSGILEGLKSTLSGYSREERKGPLDTVKEKLAEYSPKDGGKPIFEELKHKLWETEDRVKETTGPRRDHGAKGKLTEVQEKVSETGGAVKDTAAGTLKEAQKKASETAGAAKETAKDTTGTAKDIAAGTLKGAQEKTYETARAAKDTAKDTAGAAKDITAGTLTGAQEKTSETARTAKETAEETKKRAEGYVKEKVGGPTEDIGRLPEAIRDRLVESTRGGYEGVAGSHDSGVDYLRQVVGGGTDQDEESFFEYVRHRLRQRAESQPGEPKQQPSNFAWQDEDEEEGFYEYLKHKLGASGVSQPQKSYYESAKETVGSAGERAKEYAGEAKDTAKETAETAGEKLRGVGHLKNLGGRPNQTTGRDGGESGKRVHGGVSQGSERRGGYLGSPRNLIPDDDSDDTEEFYAWIKDNQARERECDCKCSKDHAPGSARDVASTVGGKVADVGQKVIDTAKEKTVGSDQQPGTTGTDSGPHGMNYLESVGPIRAAASTIEKTSKPGSKPQDNRADDRTEKVSKSPGGGLFTSLARFIHLAGVAFSYGTSLWMTFLSGQVLSKVITRQQFGLVQSRLFPAYLKVAAIGQADAFLLHSLRHPWWSSDASEKLQFLNLSFTLAASLINIFYLEPQVSRVMFERLKLEKDEGSEHVNGHTASTPKAEVAQLGRQFNILHGYSSLVNLLSLVGQTWHLWYLSRRLVI